MINNRHCCKKGRRKLQIKDLNTQGNFKGVEIQKQVKKRTLDIKEAAFRPSISIPSPLKHMIKYRELSLTPPHEAEINLGQVYPSNLPETNYEISPVLKKKKKIIISKLHLYFFHKSDVWPLSHGHKGKRPSGGSDHHLLPVDDLHRCHRGHHSGAHHPPRNRRGER